MHACKVHATHKHILQGLSILPDLHFYLKPTAWGPQLQGILLHGICSAYVITMLVASPQPQEIEIASFRS